MSVTDVSTYIVSRTEENCNVRSFINHKWNFGRTNYFQVKVKLIKPLSCFFKSGQASWPAIRRRLVSICPNLITEGRAQNSQIIWVIVKENIFIKQRLIGLLSRWRKSPPKEQAENQSPFPLASATEQQKQGTEQSLLPQSLPMLSLGWSGNFSLLWQSSLGFKKMKEGEKTSSYLQGGNKWFRCNQLFLYIYQSTFLPGSHTADL